MKILSILFILIFSLSVAGQNRLDSIRKIYIDNLGDSDSSALIREKLRARLVQSGRFEVVESKEDADAVLTGAASVNASQSGKISTDASGNVSGASGTIYAPLGVVRLLSVKSPSTVWIYEYKPKMSFKNFVPMGAIFSNPSASGKFADKVVQQLLKDADYKKKKNSNPNKK